jgi:membrane protease YdiL (CAAX protease family)
MWRGQLLLFDRRPLPTFSSQQGYKLLLIVFLLEFVVRRLTNAAALRWGFARDVWWPLVQMAMLLLLAWGLVVGFAGVRLSELGLYGWRRWSKSEKHFFPQIVAITLIVFSFAVSAEIKAAWRSHHLWQIACFIFVPQMIWGFYQEFLYRGMVQTVLVWRWGPLAGILMSNLVFTFGPLHAYHFWLARGNAAHLGIFAGIFAIGLYFALLYRRSGNLWIVGILHGVGDFFIDGLAMVSRLAN